MKNRILLFLLIALSANAFALSPGAESAQGDPWTPQQLLAPADLARTISNPKTAKPVIFSIGMQAIIKGSVDIGPAMMRENLTILKQKLEKLPKGAEIVVYCGCCPFSRCPNVRPAMELLKSMSFTNYKLLNLPQNIKVDWIDKGYPLSN